MAESRSQPSKLPATLRLQGETVNLYEDTSSPPSAKARRFKMRSYTGAPVAWLGYELIFDLKGGKVASATPILQQHDPKLIVGLADKVTLSETDGLGYEGVMYNTQAARDVTDLADQKFPWQASMGVSPLDVELAEEDRVVNGHQMKAPFLHCHSWKVKESSFVPLGADDATRSLVLADDGEGSIEIRKVTMSKESVPPAPVPDLVSERKRIADITQAFPEDPGFANKHINLGSSLLEAKADYAEHLKLEIAKMKARPQNDPVPSPAHGGGNAGGGQVENHTAAWQLALADATEELKKRGVAGSKLKFEALKLADRRHPGLRDAYLEEFNQTEVPRIRAVRRNVAQGK